MMAIKNLVSILISQHRVLQGEVGKMISSSKDAKNSKEIFEILNKFKEDLVEHLELENDTFYVELLEKMKKKALDVSKTEEFIGEMKIIEKEVYKFLEKYSTSDIIGDKIEDFHKDLVEMGEVLTIRIESEEAGVYSYWFLF